MKVNQSALAFGLMVLGTLPVDGWAGVNVQTFPQAVSETFQTTESAFLDRGPLDAVFGPREIHLGVHYNFADNPLVEYNPVTNERTSVLIDGMHTLQLSGAYQAKTWAAALVVPIQSVKLAGQSYSGALGDMRAQGKLEVARSEDNKRAFIVVSDLTLPTGNSDLFVSNGSFGFGAKGVVEQDFGFMRGALSLGFTKFGGASFRNIDYGLQLPYSLAVSLPLGPQLAVNAEFFQSITIPRNSLENPGELFVGGKFRLREDTIVSGGASFGQADFLKANDLRVHLGFEIRFSTR